MEEILPKLVAFPSHSASPKPLTDERYDMAIRDHIDIVKKIKGEKLIQLTPGGENALDIINPSLNTVSYAYVLSANFAAHKNNGSKVALMSTDDLFTRIETFLMSFDTRQIRYLGSEFINIIDNFIQLGRLRQTEWQVVGPIAQALLKLDSTGSMFTSTHLVVVKLALESQNYIHAIPLIEKYILYFPGIKDFPKIKYICDMSLSPSAYITPESKLTAKLKYQDLLEYFYYSGLIFIGLKNWEASLKCLENAVTYPIKDQGSVSKIMVESYRKWVLVGILVEGRLLPLPKSTSSAAAKVYHVLGKAHETLARIFENGTASRLKAEAEYNNQTWWNAEGNSLLVWEVVVAYQRFQIINLAKVYSKISIQEIVKETTSAETGAKLDSVATGEALVRDMISRKEIEATLATSPSGQSILCFTPGGKVLSELEIKKELAASTLRIQALTQEVKATDRMLTHDKDYIKTTQKQRKHGASESSFLEIEAMGEDEDIMGM